MEEIFLPGCRFKNKDSTSWAVRQERVPTWQVNQGKNRLDEINIDIEDSYGYNDNFISSRL